MEGMSGTLESQVAHVHGRRRVKCNCRPVGEQRRAVDGGGSRSVQYEERISSADGT